MVVPGVRRLVRKFARGLIAASAMLAATGAFAQDPGVSGALDSLRFAVIGDSGTGSQQQREIGERMAIAQQRFPFEFVLMLGDNLYGEQTPGDFEKKFERPYAELLNRGVKFYAVLGNHDELSQRYYPLFNLRGRRYYSFAPRSSVRIIGLDSKRMDEEQLRWLDKELARPAPEWTIVIMHHPLYSSGERHGPSLRLRDLLEPLFTRSGVDVVFAGHEHFYERHKAQGGIQYFISGAAGQLRKGNIRVTDQTACGFDRDNSFMLLELTPDTLRFEAIARDGSAIDRGAISRDGQEGGVSAACLTSR
jgi:3',5'-cyclic AMP phosphodiesterase CpdA